ncbi:MAG: CHAT domain-containing tetratricopeptide repeat protein [Gemmataceae bacterium]
MRPLLIVLLSASVAWSAAPPARETPERLKAIEEAERLNQRALELHEEGKFTEATKVAAQVLEIIEKLYPASQFSTGHPVLATCLNNLAALYKVQGEYGKAEPLYRQALEMREKLYSTPRYPGGHPALANSLNNLAALYHGQAEYTKAEPLLRRALEITEKLYPPSHYPTGHPDLAQSLNNLAVLYKTQAEYTKAELLYRRALDMREKLYPVSRYPGGHRALAVSINNLAGLYQAQGEYSRAEPLFRRALGMRENLYPTSRYSTGHPDLAQSLTNLAGLYESQGEYGNAEQLYRRALEMIEKLYPGARYSNGHPDLARGLNNLAGLYQARAEYGKAEPLYRRALDMREKLYPATRYSSGHPDLARSLNNLGMLYKAQGEYAKAELPYRRALEMFEKLYPTSRYRLGHPDLADSLSNLARLYRAQEEYAKAEPLLRQALGMYSASAVALASSVDEATSLNYVSNQPLVRDGYLTVTLYLPKTETYPALWLTKAALTRMVEQRQLAALATESPEARQLWDAQTRLRRERERLLLTPIDASKNKARDARLDAIDEELRQLREKLIPLLPELKRAQEQATRTPVDLQKSLPADVAYLDLLRYTRFEQDPKVKGEMGERRSLHYVAFVVTRDRISRVELGEAKALEETLDLWRQSLIEGADAEPKYATAMYQELWAPLAKYLPPEVKKLYLSPDAALTRLPWPALLDEKKARLLEKYSLTVVPHGPYLLDQLTRPKNKPTEKPRLLALGGVSYDEKPTKATELALRSPASEGVKWKALSGTRKELEQITTLAGDRRIVRREGTAATVATLLSDLPKVETAHLATHGFFADARFRSVLQLDPKLFERIGEQRATAGARSPLVLSGLVCAGANLPDTPNRGIVTAEAIVGLDLRKMHLAVLSACETGLGETAGGEGVFGLTRAFHVAGCKNVVASLWKVDDEPTAALMSLFYRQLWQSKEPIGPAEALRRAQLAMLHNPERIPEWAVGRGPLPKAISGSGKVEKVEGKPGHARVWAAFLASGLGE